MPDPIGNRREEGELVLDDATVRLLEKFRRILTEVRETAIRAGDTVTVEYVKAMYSKFVSTMGESSANRDIRRPDWMHIVRSQAFANLWRTSYKAFENGLTVVRVRDTDELHVTGGDWRTVFPEGRSTNQVKLKQQYPLPRTPG